MIKIRANNKYLAFVILVGGKSERFGSDKGLYEVNDKPLISYLIDKLKEFKHHKYLVTRDKIQAQEYIDNINYSQINGIIIDEKIKNEKGKNRSPLIGIYSALKELKELSYEKAFIISCDMPLINPEIIKLMINESQNYDICIPKWKNDYLEPLFAIYSINKTLVKAEVNLNSNVYKLTELIKKQWNINYISIEKLFKPIEKSLITFTNINRLEDLKKIKKYLTN